MYAPNAFITVSSLEDMISAYLTGLSRVFTSQKIRGCILSVNLCF